MSDNKLDKEKELAAATTESLLNELAGRLAHAQRIESMQALVARLKPIDEANAVIRNARTQQNVGMESLAELSEVSYSVLSKLESKQGHDSIQLDKLQKVLNTLGLKLYIG